MALDFVDQVLGEIFFFGFLAKFLVHAGGVATVARGVRVHVLFGGGRKMLLDVFWVFVHGTTRRPAAAHSGEIGVQDLKQVVAKMIPFFDHHTEGLIETEDLG